MLIVNWNNLGKPALTCCMDQAWMNWNFHYQYMHLFLIPIINNPFVFMLKNIFYSSPFYKQILTNAYEWTEFRIESTEIQNFAKNNITVCCNFITQSFTFHHVFCQSLLLKFHLMSIDALFLTSEYQEWSRTLLMLFRGQYDKKMNKDFLQ